jgi:uncharacterized Zn finger protein (UPF0148 family)
MSEDFDKEAERERLREKYERDKKKREATEQMSELLLQGATMTNAHCSECSDPIFRYDGQEFCPTCEKPVDRGTAEDAEDAEDGDDAEDGEGIEVTTPSDDARVAFGDGQNEAEAADAAAGEPRDDQQSQPPETPASNAAGGQPSPNAAGDQPSPKAAGDQPSPNAAESQAPAAPRQPAPRQSEPQPRTDDRQPPQGSTAATATGGADAEAAREALVETLTRFSRQAAATEDPNRAREHLAAAREAAEALAALRR